MESPSTQIGNFRSFLVMDKETEVSQKVQDTPSNEPSPDGATTTTQQPSDQPQEGADQGEPTFPIWIETCGETKTEFILQV